MGKWTSEYYDDVLGAKIKCLVSGAVKRSKLEKSEPTISYEAFVEELDTGDSFTTTLTELLVREMAERRQRQAAADRRLISDRTAKGLRTLAAPQRVYRDRGVRSINARRSLNLTDYLAMPPEEIELDDDNDSLESMVDPSGAGAVEGARMNSDLYDAYANPGSASVEPHFSPAPPHLRHVLRSATRREDWALLRDTSPDGWGPPSPVTAPSAPPLTRQPSIRRLPARSRTVDFTDFTSRRRSFGREGNNVVASGDMEADDPMTQTTVASETSPRATPNTTSVPPRRFFPSRRPELPWSPVPESTTTSTSTSTGSGTGPGTGVAATPSARSSPAPAAMTTTTTVTQAAEARDQRTFLSWLPSSTLLPLPPHPPPDLRSPRTTPRLRRGGVRPPESLLGRPHVMMQSPEPMGSAITVPSGSPGVGVDGGTPSLGDAAPTPAPDSSAPRGLSPAPAE